jgi:hypothetical protein
VSKYNIVDDMKRKAEALDYDLDAHRWLLYFAMFLIIFAILTAWALAELRDGIIASADGQQRIYKEMSVLQQQITVLQRELSKVRFDGRSKDLAPERAHESDAPDAASASTPADPNRAGKTDNTQARPKARP